MLFFRHIGMYFLVTLILVCSFPILPNDGWFSVARELEVNRSFYGEARHAKYLSAAQERFNWLFVRTGAYQTSVDLSTPTPVGQRSGQNKEFVDVSVSVGDWTTDYVRHFWDGILRAIYRWEVNQHWYVLALISLFVGVNEGLGKRQINTARTTYVSPANFHLATHFLIANVVGAILVLPWLPVVMTWPMWIIAIAFLTKFWTWATVALPSLKAQSLN